MFKRAKLTKLKLQTQNLQAIGRVTQGGTYVSHWLTGVLLLQVEPGTPTSHPGWSSSPQMNSFDSMFAVRKKRSKMHRFKRVWRVPSYLHMQVARPPLCHSDGLSKLAAGHDPSKQAQQLEDSIPDVQGACDLGYLAPCGREREPDVEEQGMPLSFGFPYVPIPAT